MPRHDDIFPAWRYVQKDSDDAESHKGQEQKAVAKYSGSRVYAPLLALHVPPTKTAKKQK